MTINKHVNMNYIDNVNNSWMITTDGKYTNVVKNYLTKEDIPEEGIFKIIQNSSLILSYCPNPLTRETCNKTGIVIGKVQSGKTSNFIALTALAFDNGYNLVVVLGGTKKILVEQNSDRISEYFSSVDDEVIVLNTVIHREYLTESMINQIIGMGKKIIVVSLKNPTQINFISKAMFNHSSLSSKATLIIDDEGDEASLNTLVAKNKKSATYQSIEKLKSSLSRHCYISVTATPQANMLISALDILSPDFGILIDPGLGYCGLDVFHGIDSKHVVNIPEDETLILEEGIPNSFINAISMFFIGCALRKYQGLKSGEKFSMLIHPSQMKVDHEIVFDKVDNLISLWRDMLNNRQDIAYEALKKILISAYTSYKNDEVIMPKFDILEMYALDAIKNCGIHVVNGDKVPNNADKIFDYNIYVGGNMLGRGLTLKGLAITYIIRTAKGVSAVDTVQQRARWFGYKKKYIDLCRVFAVNKIIKEFSEIRNHENDLWETVRTANLQGTKFKDIARIFVLSENMRMTRQNVAKTMRYSYNFWNFQRVFQDIQEYIDSNKEIINRYRKKHETEIQSLIYGEATPHKVLFNMDFEELRIEVLDKFIFPEKSILSVALIDKLSSLLKGKGISPKIDVVWMRDGIPAVHPVYDGVVGEYMVGRRPQDISRPIVYAGDRYMLEKDDFMQLQIHEITKKGSAISSPTLAIYIPKAYVAKLTNLVIRD